MPNLTIEYSLFRSISVFSKSKYMSFSTSDSIHVFYCNKYRTKCQQFRVVIVLEILNNKKMEKSLKQKFARKIKLERAKRDWSQEGLALSSDVSRNVIGQIERAEISTTLDTIEKLASAFNVDPKELFVFDDIL